MAKVNFKIEKNVLTFPKDPNEDWSLELNIVQWGKYLPKYDLRRWNDEHTLMSKGITLSADELKHLLENGGNIL